MDPGLLGGIVGAAATLVAGWWPVRAARIAAKKEAALARKVSDQALAEQKATEKAVLQSRERFGPLQIYALRIDRHRVSWHFGNNGSGRLVHLMVGLRPGQVIQNLAIPFFQDALCPGGMLLEPSAAALRHSSLPLRIDRTTLILTNAYVQGLAIADGLGIPETTCIHGVIEIPFRKMFCTSRTEAEQAYAVDEWKLEYGGISVLHPTELLEIKIRFPYDLSRLSTSPQAVVFFARTETLHHAETVRLNRDGLLTLGKRTAMLRISSPVIGLKYGITWLPPDTTI